MNQLSLRNNWLKFRTLRKMITDHFLEEFREYTSSNQRKNWRMSTCKWLDLETLGSRLIMSSKSPGTLLQIESYILQHCEWISKGCICISTCRWKSFNSSIQFKNQIRSKIVSGCFRLRFLHRILIFDSCVVRWGSKNKAPQIHTF